MNSKMFGRFFDLSNKKILLLFFAIGMLIYSNSLFNHFVADDIMQIVQNPPIRNLSNIPSLFFQTTVFDPNNAARANYYKPILTTVFSLIYFFSGNNPMGFHLVQILLHIANTALIFFIFSYFFKRKFSFSLSLIFLTHPLNTEAVVYISNLQDILFMSFGLGTLYLILRSTKERPIWLTITLLCLSILSKESGILFFIIIPVFYYLYRKRNFLLVLLQSFFALFIYLFLRFGLAHISFSNKFTIVPIMALPFWERLINIPKITFFYLKTFFFPKDLLSFQTWTVKSLTITDFFLPLILIFFFFPSIIFFGISLYKRKSKLFRVLLFFFVWLIVGLGIHLQIVPLDQTVADRWFYFPMVGLLGIAGVIFADLDLKNHLKPRVLIPALIIIVSLFSARVIARNANWRDEFTLYSHDIKYNPDSHQLELGLGIAYATNGKYNEAEYHYLRAANLFPSSNVYHGMGIFYLKFSRFERAVESFDKAAAYDPKNTYHWLYLAISKYKLGDKDGALVAAKMAQSLSPTREVNHILKLIETNQELILN